jgi:uncharacterized protein (UPF0276 family)
MSKYIDHFPVLGLGLGVWQGDLTADSIADFGSLPVDFLELYVDEISAFQGESIVIPPDLPIVLHGTQLSPAGADPIPLDLLRNTRTLGDQLSVPWVVEDLAVWRLDGRRPLTTPFWPPILDGDTLSLVASRLDALSNALGRPFVCEVPPLDVHIGTMSVPTMFQLLAEQVDCAFVLDVNHWLEYSRLVGADPLKLWEAFPFDRVIELHISGGHVVDGPPRWDDEENSAPLVDECIDLLLEAVRRCPNLCAVTVEAHGAPRELAHHEAARLRAQPEIAELCKHSSPVRRPNESPRPCIGRVASLEREGPITLLRRQRLMRDILEDPQGIDAFEAHQMQATDADQALFEEAGAKHLRRCSDDRFGRLAAGLPSMTRIAVQVAQIDASPSLRRFQQQRRARMWELPDEIELATWFAEDAAMPKWARDCVAFERDVLLVAAGRMPAAPIKVDQAGAVYVRYPRSAVRTINAANSGRPLPPEGDVVVRFHVNDGVLDVREVTAAS